MTTTGSSTASENDEAVLLREWNFERFFPDRNSASNVDMINGAKEKNNLAYQEKKKIEDMNNKLKLENRVKNAIFTKNNLEAQQNKNLLAASIPKPRPETESRFSNFVRGFRREATDISFQSKRHSAIFAEQSTPNKNISPIQRSSAIFQRNRPKGEPILTDFMRKRDNTLGNSKSAVNVPSAALQQGRDLKSKQTPSPANNLDFHRMRREKTESVISVSRNSTALTNEPYAMQQQVKEKLKLQAIFGSECS